MASKRKNKASQKEKRGTSHGEKNNIVSLFLGGGGGRAPTLAPLLRAHRCECDYIKCTMFPEIIHHIIISKYTLECTQLNFFFKILSEKHTLESSSNKIEQRYTHSMINNASEMYYNTSPFAQKLHTLVST